jgi:hypothetical protein
MEASWELRECRQCGALSGEDRHEPPLLEWGDASLELSFEGTFEPSFELSFELSFEPSLELALEAAGWPAASGSTPTVGISHGSCDERASVEVEAWTERVLSRALATAMTLPVPFFAWLLLALAEPSFLLKLPVIDLVKLPAGDLVKLLDALAELLPPPPHLESGRIAMAASLDVTLRALPAVLKYRERELGCCARPPSAVRARCLPISWIAAASSVVRWTGSMVVMERMVSITGEETCSGNASLCDLRNSAKNGHASVVELKGE